VASSPWICCPGKTLRTPGTPEASDNFKEWWSPNKAYHQHPRREPRNHGRRHSCSGRDPQHPVENRPLSPTCYTKENLILTSLVGIDSLGPLTMLKLSTKSSYGLRACLTLAATDDRLSTSDIAQRDQIPRRYLEQILSALRQSGLVQSVRGAKGGYSLGKPADEITIAQLVHSVEGNLPPMLCTNPSLQSDTCRSDSKCDCSDLCNELEGSVTRVLEGTTLADILSGKKSLIPSMTGDAHDGEISNEIIFASSLLENDTR
jgi:Rrf2 family protein